MKVSKYFNDHFSAHLRSLAFSKPNRIVREEIFNGRDVLFFGGRNWENAAGDLGKIPHKDQPGFILLLFMITITDQCIHAHFRDYYPEWHRLTRYPKFGWSGFGPHIENPMKILWVPEKESLIAVDRVIEMMPEFVGFFKNEVESFMGQNLPDIQTDEFFKATKNDEEYSFDKGEIIKAFKTELRGNE